jgi:signal transduction histidine kinase/ActR/RegA family two-component response regulator
MIEQPFASPEISQQKSHHLPLRWLLVVPFVLQIFAAVGLTGYFSLRNGQKAVNTLANQLQDEVTQKVDQHLSNYLSTPPKMVQLTGKLMERGLLDPHDMWGLGQHFYDQIQAFENLSYINFGSPAGEFVGVGVGADLDPNKPHLNITESSYPGIYDEYELDKQGNPTQKNFSSQYNHLEDTWYTEAVAAKKLAWSDVYAWEEPLTISVSASYPVYDGKQKLIGVMSIDLLLQQIGDFLETLEISPSAKVFIFEKNGLLIGASDAEEFEQTGETLKQISVLASEDSTIRAVSQSLVNEFGSLSDITSKQFSLKINEKKTYVQTSRWQDEYGLDWIVVTAIPETDFMGQIEKNTRTTILLCSLALATATGVGIVTARQITEPLLKLARASQAIASGDLSQTIQPAGTYELRTLGHTFNQMAHQLRESFTTLEKTNEVLEQRVAERTTELQTAKETADSANSAKSDFLANMSHELRTPLNGILGYAQILGRDPAASRQQKDGLNIIQQCGNHLLTLINDILDISKIEARKLEIHAGEFGFENFLHGVTEICRIKAEQKEIGFDYTALNQLPTAICTDEKRLRQVLINLLGNAIKFTDVGSVVLKVGLLENAENATTQAENQPAQQQVVRFQIEDTGVGMSPDQLEKIFLPFEQVGDSDRMAEGTGLGLAISRQIVEMMGGHLQVKSTYGEGSTFWFDLPLEIAANWIEQPTHLSTKEIVGYQGDVKTLLVVDDRWENRSVLVNLLGPIGFNIIEADNGKIGLEKATASPPDLIITDLAMPVINGFQLAEQIRKIDSLRLIPIIASSASVFEFDRNQSHEAGCDEFLPKPIQTEELFGYLEQYLQLVWCYESANIGTETAEAENTAFVAPPIRSLVPIYEAARAGYIIEVKAAAEQLKQQAEYISFANKILAMAADLDDDAIADFIEPYLA